jgi:hypothetical protein
LYLVPFKFSNDVSFTWVVLYIWVLFVCSRRFNHCFQRKCYRRGEGAFNWKSSEFSLMSTGKYNENPNMKRWRKTHLILFNSLETSDIHKHKQKDDINNVVVHKLTKYQTRQMISVKFNNISGMWFVNTIKGWDGSVVAVIVW